MLFGKVYNVRDTGKGNVCQIQVLAYLNYEGGQIKNVDTDVIEHVGPTGSVFVPNNLSLNFVENELVYFTVKENLRKETHFGGDRFILDKRIKELVPYHVFVSNKSNVEDITSEHFYLQWPLVKDKVYVKASDGRVYGEFIAKNDGGNVTVNVPANKSFVKSWEQDKLNLLLIHDYNEWFLLSPPDTEGEHCDLATEAQLKNWFSKKLKALGNLTSEQFKEIISAVATTINSESVPKDIQRWKRMTKIVESISWDLEELQSLAEKKQFREIIENKVEQFKSEFLNKHKIILEKELKEQQSAIEELKKEKEKLQKECAKYEKAKLSFKAINDEFSKNREEIIQQTMFLQSVIGMPNKTIASNPAVNSLPIFSTPETSINEKKFHVNVAKALKENNYEVSPRKISLMQAALETCKGIFVPNIHWSVAYCSANPYYHHFSISIDPSIKNIKDLWDLYLSDIISIANNHPEQQFYIHFDGVNNSVPDVWMKAIQNLVLYKGVRVPVKGLPLWPENIYFFFSPAKHKYAFELSVTALGYFPSIHHLEPVPKKDETQVNDERIPMLAEKILEKTGKDLSECETYARSLFFDYAPFFLDSQKNHV